MRVAVALMVVTALALCSAETGSATLGKPFKRCGYIVFTPRTEDGIGDIRARRTSCRQARKVARAARDLGIVDGPYGYEADGFRCRGRLQEFGLPVVHWHCAKGMARISFDRS